MCSERVAGTRWLALWLGVPAAVVLLLASPILWGQVPFPTDLLAAVPPWAGRVPPPARPPDFTRIDSLVQYAANSLVYAEGLRQGRIDLWDPYLFAGHPLYAETASLVSPFFPTTLLLGATLPAWLAVSLQPLLLLWLMGVAMAAFLRGEGLRPGAALLGAVAWMCATNVHHWFAMPVFAVGLWGIPALCACASALARRPGPRPAAAGGLVFGIVLLGQSPNPVIFALTLAGVWLLCCLSANDATRPSPIRVFAWAAVGLALGAGLGALGWLPMLEALGQINRALRFPWSDLYALRMPPVALASFLLPEFLGGVWSGRSLAAHSLVEITHGLGIVSLGAAAFALRHSHRRLVHFAVGVCVVGTLAALGTPVGRALALLPGYGTSLLGRMLQPVEWAVAVLVALGADWLLARGPKEAGRRLWRAAAVLTVVAVALVWSGPWIISQMSADFARDLPRSELEKHFAMTAPWWRPAWLGLALVFLGGLIASRARPRYVIVPILAVALLAERRWTVRHQTPWRPADTLFPRLSALQPLASAPPPRVLNPAGLPNALKPVGLASPGGYDPFILRSYLRLLELGFPDHDFRGYHFLKAPAESNRVSNLLGVAGVLLPPGSPPPAGFVPHPDVAGYAVNPDAWPRALVVPDAIGVASEDEAVSLLREATHDWAARAVVTGPAPEGPRGGRGHARILEYAADRVRVEVEADAPAFLLLTDQFYPGWSATVDGGAADILRAYLCLRLVPIDAGRHVVEFVFRPPRFRAGLVVGCLSALALGAGVLVAPRDRGDRER